MMIRTREKLTCNQTLWRVMAVAVSLLLVSCVSQPKLYSIEADVAQSQIAYITGSAEQSATGGYQYYAVKQVNYNDVNGRFSNLTKQPHQLVIPLAPRQHDVWVEGRFTTAGDATVRRVATLLTFTPKPGNTYQIVGNVQNRSAVVSIVETVTRAIVATNERVEVTLPPPGYPMVYVPIFIVR
jgi:hypothetical protein